MSPQQTRMVDQNEGPGGVYWLPRMSNLIRIVYESINQLPVRNGFRDLKSSPYFAR